MQGSGVVEEEIGTKEQRVGKKENLGIVIVYRFAQNCKGTGVGA